jgi:dTDP-4-dehydrorhamnose 3,5-epimerase
MTAPARWSTPGLHNWSWPPSSMIFRETKLPQVFEIRMQPMLDERGSFARSWCIKEFQNSRLNPRLVQCNVSFNLHRGTLRGLHYQDPPFSEAKLVRCTKGAVFDVVVDLRPDSPTFRDWVGVVLDERNRHMIYVPEGCAHGFLTLEQETEVFYQMSEFYSPESARGVRWDDPAFNIVWPGSVDVISKRDRTYPNFEY